MAEDSPTLPTPIENLLPLALRREYQQDVVVNTAFQHAARNNDTREAALISAVALLAAERARIIAELARVVREAPAPAVQTDRGTSVPTDERTSVPADADDTGRCRICGRAWPCPDEAKHVERDWFFTFGSGHTYHGESLARAFVRFYGTGLAARLKMCNAFGTAFSHQYASAEEAGVERYGLYELHLPEEPEATDG